MLDEQALLAAMAYVDLNPIRAGVAETPKTSDYTSIQERLGSRPAAPEPKVLDTAAEQPLPQAPLMPFDATGRTAWAVPFAFEDYAELVDWTGRALHPNKKGFIAAHQPKILDRVGLDGDAFIDLSTCFLKEFGSAVGSSAALRNCPLITSRSA